MSLLPGLDVSGDNTKEHVSDRNATKSMDLFPQRAGLGLRTPPAATAAKNKESELKKNQLTIFYCGKVLVFDNFPAEKAKDLMMLAGKGCGVAENYNSSPSTVTSAALAEAKNKSSSISVSVAINNTPAAATVTATQRPVQTVVSGHCSFFRYYLLNN